MENGTDGGHAQKWYYDTYARFLVNKIKQLTCNIFVNTVYCFGEGMFGDENSEVANFVMNFSAIQKYWAVNGKWVLEYVMIEWAIAHD